MQICTQTVSVLTGGGHQGGALVGGHGAGGAPLDAALAVDEQRDDLLFVGNGEVVEEFLAVNPERDDPVQSFGVGLIAAHRGSFPPAKDEVFLFGYGKLVVAKLKIGVLECLRGGKPRIDIVLLLGLEGDEEQVELALELAGQRDFLLVETVGRDGWKDGLLRLLRVEERQQRAYERQDQEWESMPQSEGPETGVQKRFALLEGLEAWYHPENWVISSITTPGTT